jgi:ferric-dicitrate binding protein FerR (iron transport regulator)
LFKPSSKHGPKRIGQLIIKYLTKDLTTKEAIELTKWLSASKKNKQLFFKLKDPKVLKALIDSNYALIYQELNQLSEKQTLFTLNFNKQHLYIAAAILIAVFISIYTLVSFSNKSKKVIVDQHTPQDAPASAGIILTLPNGRTIDMDSVTGPIIQAGIILKKYGDELACIPVSHKPKYEEFNTITTSLGKNFKVVFADGSKVWLNAGSSLRFPTSFNNTYRRVKISGEAYFEIAPQNDPEVPGYKIPFIVSVGSMEISVKGTRFNVQAYEHDVKTTLFEGSIAVKEGKNSCLLRPGQQAHLSATGTFKVNTNFDEEEILAWKKDLFVFNDLEIEPLMRQIARWYNVDIVYEDVIMDRFTTTVPRDLPLNQVLHILELIAPVHFRIDNNTVIVSK